ncbi:MAG: sulfurtransferase [Armatimonadia bacterium]
MAYRVWLVVLVGVLATSFAGAQGQKLLTTEALAGQLGGEGQKIIDMREKIQDYWAGHIPGAQWVSPEALRWPENGVPGMVMPVEQLAKLLSALGVTRDTTVVVYAEQSNYPPAYLVWALDYLGHQQSAMLDGGFKKWQAENRTVTQDYPAVTPCPCFSYIGPNNSVRALTDQVLRCDEKTTVLLDVRQKKLYTGEEGTWQRKGHIPGAIWHFWGDDLKADGTWKSKEELRATYAALGVTPDKRIITSCGQGQMSAHTYFTLKYVLGFSNVSNYDGSFNVWSSVKSLPVVTGENPR